MNLHGAQLREDGGLQVRLTNREHSLLRTLPDQLRPILLGTDDPTGVRARLFPPAYDDPEQEEEYRGLIGDSLATERIAAVDVFAETLARGRSGPLMWTVELSPDDAAAWLSALNDTRLTLASAIGIRTEADWERNPDQRDPTQVALYYLGWLQEELIGAMSGSG